METQVDEKMRKQEKYVYAKKILWYIHNFVNIVMIQYKNTFKKTDKFINSKKMW